MFSYPSRTISVHNRFSNEYTFRKLKQKHTAISPAQTTTFRFCFVGFLLQLSLYVQDFQLTSPSPNV